MRHHCLAPRCPELVGKGGKHCARHTTEAARRDAQQRGTAAERGYDHEWQAAAAEYLKAHPYCERCQQRGRRRKAVLVDHKQALRDGGARLDRRNFEAQCRHCHGIKTHAETKARVTVTPSDFFQAPPRKTARKSSLIAPSAGDALSRGEFFV